MATDSKIHFCLTFPAPPNMSQHTKHYWRRYSEKKKYEGIANMYLISQWPKLPREARQIPWPKFTWKMHAEVWSEMDYDNLLTLAKWPIDTLKKGRIITDDNPRVAMLGAVPTQEIKRKGERKVYLEIQFENQP